MVVVNGRSKNMAKTLEEMNKNERWAKKNLARVGFVINKNTEQDLVDFLDGQMIPKSEICRLGVKMFRLITHDLEVITRYKADNGDEFVRLRNDLIPQLNEVKGTVKCTAVRRREPVEHLSYYTEDGEFIGTAGTHIHEKMTAITEFLYTKRVSGKTQNDTITETLGYQD